MKTRTGKIPGRPPRTHCQYTQVIQVIGIPTIRCPTSRKDHDDHRTTTTLLAFGIMLTLIGVAVNIEDSTVSWVWAAMPWLGAIFIAIGLATLATGLLKWQRK